MAKEISLRQAQARVGTEADWRYVESMSEVQARAMTTLWVRGASYTEIADEWQVTTAVARLAVERALSDALDDSEDRGKQRQRLSMQLDTLMRQVMPRALNGKDKEQGNFIRMALMIGERKAKLLGLDAPTQINLAMPSEQELSEWMEAVVTMKGGSMPVEGDPFMLEENPDTGVFE
jgi:hypothetical protein